MHPTIGYELSARQVRQGIATAIEAYGDLRQQRLRLVGAAPASSALRQA